eukprot:CAMPEP_0171451692 /NCGR_PEP_ID=MMETSP0945-20130129/94_1 /TAXON_ID=109269 /ORGANISM="Vaucheria litorea, Strain CCMP2940" /LENGTH=188 /DNA_ID=CAMNT_0011976201 /DNA_START=333 /DNA_END=899 /DNA_ORIENTATION=-
MNKLRPSDLYTSFSQMFTEEEIKNGDFSMDNNTFCSVELDEESLLEAANRNEISAAHTLYTTTNRESIENGDEILLNKKPFKIPLKRGPNKKIKSETTSSDLEHDGTSSRTKQQQVINNEIKKEIDPPTEEQIENLNRLNMEVQLEEEKLRQTLIKSKKRKCNLISEPKRRDMINIIQKTLDTLKEIK